ncbi:MAG TPA: CxxC-x17-CxxC domain-containing protein, partial [Dehalococcoidia bacterium]|nr:CxxC-x17-CxxC domain-containing protein [Dehalococcoidia bacterium]
SRGLMNEPGRCPECRQARKGRGGGGGGGYSSGGYSSGGYSSSGGYGRESRQMYSATCAQCGQEALLPFEPRTEKPVYCSDCFQSQRGGGGGYRSSRY